MSERMGNGGIQIQITVYPDLDGGEKYNKSVTRAITIDHMGGLVEMQGVTYDMGSMVSSILNAMIGTLHARAKEAAEAEAAEQAPGDDDDVI